MTTLAHPLSHSSTGTGPIRLWASFVKSMSTFSHSSFTLKTRQLALHKTSGNDTSAYCRCMTVTFQLTIKPRGWRPKTPHHCSIFPL